MKRTSTPVIQIRLNEEQAKELEAKANFRGDVPRTQWYVSCLMAGIRAAKSIKPTQKPVKKEEKKIEVEKEAEKKVVKKTVKKVTKSED